MTYSGAPWRSRFLRGPKMGLELAARSDFVALADPTVATVRIGLKTGADKFFFVTSTGKPAKTGRVHVQGLGGWTGELPRADLVPASRSPKDLDVSDRGRLYAIPAVRGTKAGVTYYLLVRKGRLDAVTKEYAEYAEKQNIHKLYTVKRLGDPTRWFRQTLIVTRSQWALPYNSGYNYGALDNRIAAVLNGRFVGVEPATTVDSQVLGGVLNSTMVAMMRLLEGVATGNEGAFDMGARAVQVMRVPDPRLITSNGTAEVKAALAAIEKSAYQVDAPSSTGEVSDLRADLDTAVLTGLGMSRGDAVTLQDRLYLSYGRWRHAVEAVENQMQANRRALARRGGSRTQSLTVRAIRTVFDEMQQDTPLLLADLTTVPTDIVNVTFPKDDHDTQISLFDDTIVTSHDDTRVDLGDPARVSLARHIRNLGMSGPFPLPTNPQVAARLLTDANAAEKAFTIEARTRAAAHVNDDTLAADVAEGVRRIWLANSITSLREHIRENEPTQDAAPSDPSLFATDGMLPTPPS